MELQEFLCLIFMVFCTDINESNLFNVLKVCDLEFSEHMESGERKESRDNFSFHTQEFNIHRAEYP